MSLIVNRRDIDFLLYELLDLDALLEAPRYRAFDRSMLTEIFDTAQSLAEEKYLPCAAALDANEPKFADGRVQIIPEVGDALRAYAAAGFFAASFDESFGGQQLPQVVCNAINGMFSCANLSIANYAFLTTASANMLCAFGNDEQRKLFLPPMLEGRWFGTMCLSEPQAGSSLSDIKTRADPNSDGSFRIAGSKMWISGGDQEISENIVHLVLAKIPGGPPGVKGISLFIVPKYRVNPDGGIGDLNNVALAGLNHKMGQRGTSNCLLNFGEGGDSLGWLIGEPHKGLHYMFHMMNEARIGVGHASIMSGLAGYLYSLQYARDRPQGRLPMNKNPLSPQTPIIEHADVKRMLMAQKAAVEGALALSFYCASLIDWKRTLTGAKETREIELLLEILTPVAKSWPSEHCLEANKLAIQVLGGYGYTRDYPVERFYRDNRLNHIHEGTFGVQGLDLLGRKVRMHNGEALDILAHNMDVAIAEASESIFAAEARALKQLRDVLLQATAVVAAQQDLNSGLANATLYLDAFGTIVIAWMWLRQGLAAVASAEGRGGADQDFYAGKIAACQYFYRYELPKADAQLKVVASLDDVCLRLKPQHFVGV